MTDIAVVTGAGGALGAEVARVLAARGCQVVLSGSARGEERLQALRVELGSGLVMTGDVADEQTWSAALPRIERELGAPPNLAALVAGGWQGGTALHAAPNDDVWRAMISGNLDTAHRSLRALLPAMVARRRGSIVLVGSRAAVQPWTSANAAAYAASKAAVLAMAQASATEVAEHGVRINVILPSTLDTPTNRAAMPRADASRWVSLRSAAEVVAFLLSDGARDVNGAAIPVYGRA